MIEHRELGSLCELWVDRLTEIRPDQFRTLETRAQYLVAIGQVGVKYARCLGLPWSTAFVWNQLRQEKHPNCGIEPIGLLTEIEPLVEPSPEP